MQKVYKLLTSFTRIYQSRNQIELYQELKSLNKESQELKMQFILVPGTAQSSSQIDKIQVKLVNKLCTFCIHVVTTNPVQRALKRSSMIEPHCNSYLQSDELLIKRRPQMSSTKTCQAILFSTKISSSSKYFIRVISGPSSLILIMVGSC